MSDTILTVLVATLIVLAGGVAVGETGPLAAGTADSVGQETTQDGDNQTTTRNATGQATTQSAGGQDSTNVTARNVTIERLVLQNATVLDANFGELTVRDESGENATNETYSDVSVRRIEASGNVTDLTLTNVSITDESLATALVGEEGRQRIETRLVIDRAVLQNQTVDGLAVESATVSASTAENVSGGAEVGAGNQSENGGQADDQPAISAESAAVEGANFTDLNVSDVSVGAETTAQATETTETVQVNATTTEQATQTTAEEGATENQTTVGADETTETTTTPAEARSGATDEGTTTTEDDET